MFPPMIGTVVFVLAFVLVGLTVVLVAMSGGARGARSAAHGQSRGTRRFMAWALGIAILAFGVAIPILLGVHNGASSAKRGPQGLDLSSAQAHGRAVFARNCSQCHTLAGANAVGKVGPNLDVLRPPAALVENAVAQGRARGQGQMPAGLVSGRDLKDVASFVAAVAGRTGS
jgi:mono/diheme cytochrome c family protein